MTVNYDLPEFPQSAAHGRYTRAAKLSICQASDEMLLLAESVADTDSG